MLRAWGEAQFGGARRPLASTDSPERSQGSPAVADEGNVPPRAARLRVLLIVLGYLAAAVVVTWRLWADPASRTVAGNPDDADQFAWFMRYAATAVAHGQLPSLVTTTLNSPQGVNMMWNSSLLLPCIVLAPVTLVLGPQVSLTILTTVGFAGSATAMFWALRRWRVSTSAAALAGAVYGFSPALVHSAIGHYNLQLAVLPPLIIDAGLRLAIGPLPARGDPVISAPAISGTSGLRPSRLPPQVRDGVRLGLLLAVQLFVSEELALTTTLAGVLLAAGLVIGFPQAAARRITRALAGLAVAACTTLALAGWALWVQFAGPLTQSGSPFLQDFYENDLTGFVTPSGYLLFHTSASAAAAARYQGGAPEYLGYLGWPLIICLVLAVALFWRRPAIRALGITVAVLGVFSLGGHLLASGVYHAGVSLPWHWVEALPLAGSVLPDRLSILADGAAAALLAVSLDVARTRLVPGSRSGHRAPAVTAGSVRAGAQTRFRPAWASRRTALMSAVAVLACLPLLPLPLPAASASPLPPGWRAAFAALRLSPGARVLVVPVPEVHLTAAMRWEADTSRPYSLIGGYFIGPAWNGLAYVDGNGLTATQVYLDQLWVAGLTPGSAADVAAAAANLGPPGAPPALSQVRADLATWRPAAVVAVTSASSALGHYLIQIFGLPTVQTGSVIGWRLG